MSFQVAHDSQTSVNSGDDILSVHKLGEGDVTQLTKWMASRDGRSNDIKLIHVFHTAAAYCTVISTYVRRLLTVDACLMNTWHRH